MTGFQNTFYGLLNDLIQISVLALETLFVRARGFEISCALQGRIEAGNKSGIFEFFFLDDSHTVTAHW